MARFVTLWCGVLIGGMICAASPAWARGDDDDDERLARRLLGAAEKHAELRDVSAKYGRRAELALTILRDEHVRAELHAHIRDMNTTIADFPANRRWWLAEHQAFYQQKLACDRQLTALDREITDLKFQEREMYEEELRRAEASGKPIRPVSREALLHEFQRLDRECKEAVVGLKERIESVARKEHVTRGQVLDRAVSKLESVRTESAPVHVERDFLPAFKKTVGGRAWLDGQPKPPPPSKPKKASARTKKTKS
jgi:hypothetical protein